MTAPLPVSFDDAVAGVSIALTLGPLPYPLSATDDERVRAFMREAVANGYECLMRADRKTVHAFAYHISDRAA